MAVATQWLNGLKFTAMENNTGSISFSIETYELPGTADERQAYAKSFFAEDVKVVVSGYRMDSIEFTFGDGHRVRKGAVPGLSTITGYAHR